MRLSAFVLIISLITGAASFSSSFFLICNLYAGTFDGLEPGSSTKNDADRILGGPVKEVVKNRSYEYNGKKYDASKLRVLYDKMVL